MSAPLPAQGSTSWYPWASWVDGVVRGSSTSSSSSAVTAPANTIVIYGDSLTAINLATSSNSLYYSGRGFWTWAATRLRHRLRLLNNAGVSGQTIQEIQARLSTDVQPYSPGWVHILAGTNNLTTSDSASDMQTALGALWDSVAALGARLVVSTMPPRTGLTTAQQTKLVTVNEWIRAQARTRENLVVVDYFAALVDPATTCDYVSAYTYDGTHPTTTGAARMGKLLADTLDPLVPQFDPVAASPGSPGLLSTNPFQIGTGGSTSNGATGTVATDWVASPVSGSGGVAASKVARGDVIAGEWTQLVCSNATQGARLYITNTGVGTAWNVGDQVYGWAEYQTDYDWSSVTQFRLSLSCLDTGFSSLMAAHDVNWQSGDIYDPAGMHPPAGLFRTPTITVPTGTTLRLQLEFIFQGIGTVRLGRAGFAKIVP